MNSKAILTIAALGGALSACTTLGTNVSGSFRCDAPDGVCAPSTVIDDNAISRIEETSSIPPVPTRWMTGSMLRSTAPFSRPLP